jgi:hypothetical protein
VGYLRQN